MKRRAIIVGLSLLLGCFALFSIFALFLGSHTGSTRNFPLSASIGVVEIDGAIMDSKQIIDDLLEFEEDHSVKALVLRVDSPGGAVGPSQEIYDEVRRIAKNKVVIVSMGSVAASGGYYVAVAGRKIYANPGTLTGSIGVIMEFPQVIQLLDKVGIKKRVVKSGIHKDIGSPVREITPEEQILLQTLIDDVHSQFIEAVCQSRHLPEDKVKPLADGRIFTGRQAKELGLVDELGGLQVAVKEAARLAGIQGDPKVVYPEKQRADFLDYLMTRTAATIKQLTLQSPISPGMQFLWSL
ncbi:MAG: signal peptide peptidase SppA [Desulfuromonadaceae bacterium]|nr:signal peptide peptidase SppA [Desulfuromonadaceae bacterium]